AGHPVELPAADAGLEDRAGARGREHGRPEAGLDDAAERPPLRPGVHAGRPARGRREHRPRAVRHRDAPRQPSRRRQGRLHRLDPNTDVGAINSKAQLEKITELVAAGVAEGADMYQPACDLPERGYFFRPTLFTNVAQSHRIAREEIFGPVLSVLTFRTPDEAVEKANNTEYGLSAGVWTEKGSRILWMVRKLKAGVVWANTFNKFDPTSPFGGYKESGFG